MDWIEYLGVIWPIASVATPLLIGGATLWLRSQFVLKAEDVAEQARIDAARAAEMIKIEVRFTGVADKIATLENRINLLEQAAKESPTRHELSAQVAEVSAGLRGLQSMMAGYANQLSTANSYLQTLIDQGLRR